MTIDVGTGDGRAVIATALAQPATLAIGIDADAASMAEASRRAARGAARGGAPNALFIVAAAEAFPPELAGVAAHVTVTMPWGSLLRGCLGGAPEVAAGLAGLLGPAAILELLVAPATRDRLADLPTEPEDVLRAIAAAFEPCGLRLVKGRPASAEELRASRSSWARRLLASRGADRTTILARLRS